ARAQHEIPRPKRTLLSQHRGGTAHRRRTAHGPQRRPPDSPEQTDPRAKRTKDTFFFSSRRRHTRSDRDWSSDVCSSDLDVLREYMAQHAWVYPVEPALKVIVDMFEWCAEHAPLWNTISISGYHIREAGATAAQELAFTLANGFTYVDRAVARGLDVERFAPRLSFFWDVHNDFFEEIAKLRAARRIWARHMRERFAAANPRSWMMRFHCQTAGVTLTAQQPMNNVVRVAYQALAAVLGGTQSLHTNSLDETLALPTE